MALSPYHPSTDLFGSVLEDLFTPMVGRNRASSMLRGPDADVIERENEIRVVLEIAGLRPEDVEVELENNVLTVSGEKRLERNEGEERSTFHLTERRYGRFSRSFVLPRDVDAEQIEATFQDGLLTISVPKSEKARRRRIEIRGGDGQARRVESGSTSGKE